MTNLEAFKGLLDEPAIPDTRIQGVLIVRGIDPNAEWSMSPTNPINCRFYGALIIEKMRATNGANGLKSISEGGMSVSYDSASPYLKGLIDGWISDSNCSSLKDQYTANKISDVSYLLDR
ncbi:hypothetical protein LL912_00880 [Niabella sp. CC-SYL272]|uniref:hypothetical protein n=1 Tax=Niabella agricola TaxID=2891571 RepID=UPI001F1B6101|nr:hypothetical protein [Niabella agricola]MCF3107321.1 hypothetical protein [Niabella agricola]